MTAAGLMRLSLLLTLPSPEDGTSNETDDVTTSDDGGNQPQAPEEPDVQLSEFNASEIFTVKNAISSLQQRFPNLNLNGLNIQKGDRNASVNYGIIILGDKYFSWPLISDKASILWHEIYHLQNNHNANKDLLSVDEKYKNIPLYIEDYLRYQIRNEYVGIETELSDEKLEEYYLNSLGCNQVRHSEFYENELETYKAEKEAFPDNMVSDKYIENRQYAEWEYEEKLRIAREHGF